MGQSAGTSPPRTFSYLVGIHHSGSPSPTGRGTKGYVAYDIDHRRLVFLKDYWYAVHKTVHPEADVYRRLQAAGVQYIATLVAGGDVVDSEGKQETLTRYLLLDNRRPAVKRHHRLVVKEVGIPLREYQADSQLMLVVHCALLGE